MNEEESARKYINAKQLLEMWDEGSRPSLQWLRMHTGREIPAIKIGRLYFYDPEEVRAALKHQ